MPRSSQEIDDMENFIVEQLGYEGAFEAVSKALSYFDKDDIYEYIIRCYDLSEGVCENE